jgi:hypothetical protein
VFHVEGNSLPQGCTRPPISCTVLDKVGENDYMESRHSDMKRRMVMFGLMVLIVALVAGTAFA